jgi:hypothetical protein
LGIAHWDDVEPVRVAFVVLEGQRGWSSGRRLLERREQERREPARAA